jgi:thiaminase/transcriptional activator TenA
VGVDRRPLRRDPRPPVRERADGRQPRPGLLPLLRRPGRPLSGLDADEVAATPIAPTNLAYTSYLLAAAYGGSFAEALGALLPCYWIYWEVGKAPLEQGSPNPLYARWIDTYGGEDFGAVVEEVLALTNRIGAELGDAERERVRAHFVTTSRYEWMFWEMGYRRERWPV